MRLTGRILDGLAALPGCRLLGPSGLQQRLGVVSFALEGCTRTTSASSSTPPTASRCAAATIAPNR